jgi:hypothetical protein
VCGDQLIRQLTPESSAGLCGLTQTFAEGTGPPPGADNKPPSGFEYLGAAWHRHAEELADFFWPLANRTDVWGGYRPPAERGKEYKKPDGGTGKLGAPTTRPARRLRGTVRLTRDHVVRHFRATAPEHIVGLHAVSPDNTSRWGGVDIDWHGEQSTAPEINLAAGLAWYKRLTALELTALLTDSNGKGGLHLALVLSGALPSPLIFFFMKCLTGDHASHGMTAAPETFPKQPRVSAQGQKGEYGNWLRLPGLHHTRPHWSRVWDGTEFVSGDEAVDCILSLKPSDPRLVQKALDQILEPRIRDYGAKVPHKSEGQGRDDVAFGYACWLARDLWREDETVLRWLAEWDRGNNPPKGGERLREILGNAHQYGQNAYGAGLGDRARRPRQPRLSDRPQEAPPDKTFTLGSLTLRPGAARRTKGGKLIVPVAVLKGATQVNLFQLSESLSGRKEAAKLILPYLTASDPGSGAVQGILGEVLVYAAARLDNRPEDDGPSLRDLVFSRVQEQFKIRFRTEAGL